MLELCASSRLHERCLAYVWDVLQYRQPARAFALRYDGRAVAYLNRCVHVPTEMDWTPGEFLDTARRYILCSIHGAAYEPVDAGQKKKMKVIASCGASSAANAAGASSSALPGSASRSLSPGGCSGTAAAPAPRPRRTPRWSR